MSPTIEVNVIPRDSARQIALRPAVNDDARSVWRWRNDPDTRAASFDPRPIEYVDHEPWFTARLGDEDTRIFIILDPNRIGVGYVRFDLEGDNAIISIALDSSSRGQGFGTDAILAGCSRILNETTVVRVLADVKTDNEPSKRAFINAGFVLAPGSADAPETSLRFEYPGSGQ